VLFGQGEAVRKMFWKSCPFLWGKEGGLFRVKAQAEAFAKKIL
jgi:hypothetical protein